MASIETDARLRIADGLVVIALAFTSLFMIWRPATEAWVGIISSLLAVALFALGATVLVGRTRAGRLVLTRRRWKYFMLVGVVLALIILFVVTRPSLDRPGVFPVLAVFPAVIGLFVAQLYEPESRAQFKPSDLSDRDAKTWKSISLALALIGLIVGSIAGIAGAGGDSFTTALLLPIAILFLVFAAGIWMMLRSRNRQLTAKRE